MVLNQIKKSFRLAKIKKWDKLYYFYDIHETILIPDYDNKQPLKFYPFAKEALLLISKHSLISNNLYTCSHPEEIDRYQAFFKKNGINFQHVNINPDVFNTHLGCFDTKPYMNVLFEDKAGFDALTEWEDIYHYFNTNDLYSQLYTEFPIIKYLSKLLKKYSNG